MRGFTKVFLCICVIGFAPAAFAQQSPDGIVRDIYAAYDDYGLGASPTDPDLRENFSQRMRGLLAEEDGRIERDGLGRLDFDIFVDDHDCDVTEVSVEAPQIHGDKAEVALKLRNFGEPRQFRFLFIQEDGAWRIDDIVAVRANDPWQLTALLTGN